MLLGAEVAQPWDAPCHDHVQPHLCHDVYLSDSGLHGMKLGWHSGTKVPDSADCTKKG